MKFLAYPVGVLAMALGLVACQAQSTTTAAPSQQKNTTLPGSEEARNRPPQRIDGMPVDSDNAESAAALVFKKLNWDTSGGGDLHYSIAPGSSAGTTYTLHLSAKSFRNFDENYEISRESGALYKKINALFRGKIKIQSAEASGAPTGTWSTLTLFDLVNSTTEIKSPVIQNRSASELFQEVRNFIEENISSNTDSCSTLSALEGIWKSSVTEGTLSRNSTSTLARIQTTDGSVQYSGTDETESRGCFGGSTSSTALQYVYQQDKCILSQTGSSGTDVFRITYVSIMPGFTKIKLSKCEDANCVTLKAGETPIELIRTSP